MEKKRIGKLSSPLGILGYCIGEDGLERLWFDAENEKELETTGASKELDNVEAELKKELSEYFSGRRREFKNTSGTGWNFISETSVGGFAADSLWRDTKL
ncbi:MAG: hypothetical protein ACOCMZ_07350 [Acetivibrio ethanolgignens]